MAQDMSIIHTHTRKKIITENITASAAGLHMPELNQSKSLK